MIKRVQNGPIGPNWVIMGQKGQSWSNFVKNPTGFDWVILDQIGPKGYVV